MYNLPTYNLPTYNECLNIVDQAYPTFVQREESVQGYELRMFGYNIVEFQNFFTYNAHELRGITFVFNEDGTLYERYLMMHKFFSLNQIGQTQYDNLKHLKIKNVQLKEDGSLVTFIRLPNGEIIFKTKMGSTDLTMNYLTDKSLANNPHIMKFITYCLDNDIVPMFELVSNGNRIVIEYDKTDLVLLKLRDNKTGRYIGFDEVDQELIKKINTVESFNYTWDELLELKKTKEGIEGWVVELEDGTFFKLKTDWYSTRFAWVTNVTIEHRDDYIIHAILENEIDDILSEIKYDQEVVDRVADVTNTINNYLLDVEENIMKMYDLYLHNYNKDLGAFCKDYSKYLNFNHLMNFINGDIDRFRKNLKEELKKKTYYLSDARFFTQNGYLEQNKNKKKL